MLFERRLPDLDGINILEQIRQFDPSIKAVMITSSDLSDEDRKRLQVLNLLLYKQKPLFLEQLEGYK